MIKKYKYNRNDFLQIVNKTKENHDYARIVILNGEKMKTCDEYFKEIASAFEFPDWYGMNYDATIDCLKEGLDWIENSKNYLVVVFNGNLALSNETNGQKIFFDVFETICDFFENDFEVDKIYGHYGIKFDVLVQIA